MLGFAALTPTYPLWDCELDGLTGPWVTAARRG
jgi:hypothetical protein